MRNLKGIESNRCVTGFPSAGQRRRARHHVMTRVAVTKHLGAQLPPHPSQLGGCLTERHEYIYSGLAQTRRALIARIDDVAGRRSEARILAATWRCTAFPVSPAETDSVLPQSLYPHPAGRGVVPEAIAITSGSTQCMNPRMFPDFVRRPIVLAGDNTPGELSSQEHWERSSRRRQRRRQRQ